MYINHLEAVCGGAELKDRCTYRSTEAMFTLYGHYKDNSAGEIPVTEELLSKHILLLGGIGSGKTNAMNWLTRNIRENLTSDDVMLIFDTKGDFYREFYRPGDIVISNDNRATGTDGPDYWNLFREVMIDPRQEESVLEIANNLFAEKIERSSQPFFPNAAKDLFASLLLELLRNPARENMRNNRALRGLLDSFSVPAMKRILARHSDLISMSAYIDDPNSGQTLGVVSELQQLVREIFIGNFAKQGTISIRDTIRRKGGKVVFVEYDLSVGSTLAPIYRLLVDLAIKQALCRSENEAGSVYFLLDEFRLLPHLRHIDDGVNFGRSLGAKFIIGIQNVDQIADAYGKEKATSLLSGFSTTVAFRVNDKYSRTHIRDLYGENVKYSIFDAPSVVVRNNDANQQVRVASVIEDHDITALAPGDAVVGIMNCEPFWFHFERYTL